jgi:hypothetical protein
MRNLDDPMDLSFTCQHASSAHLKPGRTPPPTPEDLQRIEELGRKYDTEYPPVPGW